MKVSFVVDVGNSRIKWGLCRDDRVAEIAVLLPDDVASWQAQLSRWLISTPHTWAIAGVHPARREELAGWLRLQGQRPVLLDSWQKLPLAVHVEHPERVGIDRLFNAVAARSRTLEKQPAVLIDAGSAVTVDWLDAAGNFAGGAIFPGLRLMARSLQDYTALLPLVEVKSEKPRVPATSTAQAIEAGVFWAVAGGIRAIADQLSAHSQARAAVFLTGGDAALLASSLNPDTHVWPEMTLEGIRLTAEKLS
jgi:type III pantothenate kinase